MIKAPEGHIGCKIQAPNSLVLKGSSLLPPSFPLAQFNGFGIGFLVLLTLFFFFLSPVTIDTSLKTFPVQADNLSARYFYANFGKKIRK